MNSPRVRAFLWRWHRRLGAIAAVLVALLAITGVALNHTDELGLDRRHVTSGWLLDWYGVEAPVSGFGFDAGGREVTLLGDHLYVDRHFVGEPFISLHGAVEAGGLLAIAADGDVLLLTADLDLVERLDRYAGVPAGLRNIGTTPDGKIAVRTEEGLWLADGQMLTWSSIPEQPDVRWATPSPPSAELLAALRADFRRRMLSVERAVLDLHSGRLFGRAGPWVMDAAAVVMTILAVSGFWLWLAGARWRRRAGRGATRPRP